MVHLFYYSDLIAKDRDDLDVAVSETPRKWSTPRALRNVGDLPMLRGSEWPSRIHVWFSFIYIYIIYSLHMCVFIDVYLNIYIYIYIFMYKN